MTKREKRYRDALNAIERTKARRESAIRMLVKCEALLPKLERKARRLGAEPKVRFKDVTSETSGMVHAIIGVEPDLPTIEPKIAADGIPDFLRRAGEEKDAAARAEIEAQVAAEKKRKAELAKEKREIKQEVRDAELTGQRRKVPLSGKAAMEHILRK